MIGALLQQVKKDALKFSASGGFQVDVVLTTPDGSAQLPVTGLATGTWITLDDTEQGKSVNTSSNHFTVHEDLLIAGEYPYKKGNRVDLKQHRVSLNDGAGMTGTYVINEQMPNATTGLIVCILGRLKIGVQG